MSNALSRFAGFLADFALASVFRLVVNRWPLHITLIGVVDLSKPTTIVLASWAWVVQAGPMTIGGFLGPDGKRCHAVCMSRVPMKDSLVQFGTAPRIFEVGDAS